MKKIDEYVQALVSPEKNVAKIYPIIFINSLSILKLHGNIMTIAIMGDRE